MKNNAVETVRFNADIVRIVSDYVVLKKAGTTLKGLCPFHAEKTPSFSVHPERQTFHCFGCNVGGDVFNFVMQIERVSFPEALKIVADKCGITIPDDPRMTDPKAAERKRLYELYERATQYFEQALDTPEARSARLVLEQRKIHVDFVKRFKLGYAPASGLLSMLKPRDAVSTGLFLKNDKGDVYDRFRRRLMFPIADDRGRTIAFGGRILGDGQPKYLNSPESPLYSKSYVLYGLHFAKEPARKAAQLVLVEGYFDCLGLHQHGITNVVASCGTSLTPPQVTILARYAPEIVMNYDPDAAGQNATKRSIDLLLGRGLRVRILKLPGGLDPDDFIRQNGAETYRRLIADAPTFWQYLIAEAASRKDLDRPDVKADMVKDVLHYVRKIQDRVEQLEVARAMAESFRVQESVILEQIGPRPRPAAVTAAAFEKLRKLSSAEKQLIHALLQDPGISGSLRPFLVNDFLSSIWSGPLLKRLIADPTKDVESLLGDLEDQDLQREVRSAVHEPFGRIEPEVAISSMTTLYEKHLSEEEKGVREQLKKYGSGAAPAELVRRQMEITTAKSRLRAKS